MIHTDDEGLPHSVDDRPATITDTEITWQKHGKLHRRIAPARITADTAEWWVEGEKYPDRQMSAGTIVTPDRSGSTFQVRYSAFVETWTCGGELHRYGNPAQIMYTPEGIPYCKFWYVEGKLHRVDGPAVEGPEGPGFFLAGMEYTEKEYWEKVTRCEERPGVKRYYVAGILHRVDGPAFETNDGGVWYRHGQIHREDGPAIVNAHWEGIWLKQGWFQDGVPHREGAPAIIPKQGPSKYAHRGEILSEEEEYEHSICWMLHHVPHREGGPAIITDSGVEKWYRHGRLHREDGPAIDAPGAKEWYIDGRLHRADGPAIEREDGSKQWFQDGKLHREDGPAIIRADGTAEHWVRGNRVGPEEPIWKYSARVAIAPRPVSARPMTIVSVDADPNLSKRLSERLSSKVDQDLFPEEALLDPQETAKRRETVATKVGENLHAKLALDLLQAALPAGTPPWLSRVIIPAMIYELALRFPERLGSYAEVASKMVEVAFLEAGLEVWRHMWESLQEGVIEAAAQISEKQESPEDDSSGLS